MDLLNNKTVLITGVGGPAGINATRLLQQVTGITIIGADIDELSAGRFFIDEFVIAPRVSQKEAYVSWLKKIIQEKNIDLFIPTVHEELPLVGVLKNELKCLTLISSPAAISLGDDKVALYKWAEENIPQNTIAWTLLSDWSPQWLNDDVQFIKPRQGRGGRGCLKMTIPELVAMQEKNKDDTNTIVMQFMPGIEWTVDAYVAQDGSMTYVVPRERIGLAGGISIKGKTVKHQSLIALSTAVCQKIGFYGPVCLQWRADNNGIPRLIEINPRLSGGLPITVAAGVNPITAVLHELRGTVPPIQDWKEVTIVGYFEYKKV